MIRIKRIITLLVSIFIFSNIFSQDLLNNLAPQKYTIADIKIEGIKYLQVDPIIKVTGLKVGEKITVPGPDITAVIDKLWKQGLFADVKISASKIEGDNIYLTILLEERARLNSLTINGVKKSADEDIRSLINFQTHMQITENKKNIAKKKILDYYFEKGYYETVVDIIEENDTSMFNKSNITININKNNRIKVAEIDFIGNNEFTDKKLRRFMKNTKVAEWYIPKKSKFIPADYNTDKAAIIAKYKKNGYRDAFIEKDTIINFDSLHKRIEITINEGPKYYFRNVSWIGNSVYNTDLLSRLLSIESGDIYNEEYLQERIYGLDGVSAIYMDNGYLFFNAEAIELSVVNDSVDIQIRIYEGPQAVINRVTVNGNSKTNDHVIYREIRTKPGSLFSRSDIIRTQRELAMLGYFDPENMGINPIPNAQDGTVDIEYTLKEKSNDQIEISGGWSGEYVVGSVRLVLNNFSLKNMFNKEEWRPIPSGDGQRLSLNVSANPRSYQYYSFSFTEPWFGGKKSNALSFTTYYSVRSNGYTRNDERYGSWKTTGVSVGLEQDLENPDDFFTLYNDLGFKRYNLDNYNGIELPSSFPDSIISKSLTFGTSFGRNSIDQPLYPRKGSMFSLRLELTPPHSLLRGTDNELTEQDKFKWIEYHKWTFKSKMYTELADKLVLETRIDMGFLGYYNKNYKSPFETFSLGGDGLTNMAYYGIDVVPMRGYESGDLTPSSGGNLYNKFSLEMRYPLSLKPEATIYGLVFAEAGNAWTEFEDYNPFNIKRSAGFGVRVFIPMMGLLGFDFGYGFDQKDENPNGQLGGWNPSFVLGQQF